jgi:hypothetical protein
VAPKLLIVLVVGLVVLFVVGLGGGVANSGIDTASFPPASVQSLAGLLVRKQPLAASDVSGSCLAQNGCSIPQGGTLTVQVQPSSSRLRSAHLLLRQGPGITVSLPPPGQSPAAGQVFGQVKAATGATAELDIDPGGGALAIACQGAANGTPPCLVVLTPG